MILMTSYKVAKFDDEWRKLKTLLKKDNTEFETLIVRITKKSQELPERIREWLSKRNDTFFDKDKKRKRN